MSAAAAGPTCLDQAKPERFSCARSHFGKYVPALSHGARFPLTLALSLGRRKSFIAPTGRSPIGDSMPCWASRHLARENRALFSIRRFFNCIVPASKSNLITANPARSDWKSNVPSTNSSVLSERIRLNPTRSDLETSCNSEYFPSSYDHFDGNLWWKNHPLLDGSDGFSAVCVEFWLHLPVQPSPTESNQSSLTKGYGQGPGLGYWRGADKWRQADACPTVGARVRPGQTKSNLLKSFMNFEPVLPAVVSGPKIESDTRSPVRSVIGIGVWRRTVIVNWRRSITWSGLRRIGRRRHVHVEKDFRWDAVFGSKQVARAEEARLDKLIGADRQRAHDIKIRAEVVERTVWVTKDFDVYGSRAAILAVGFDVGAGRGGIDENIIGHGVVRTTFSAWRDGCSTSCKYDDRGQARGGNPLGNHGVKIASNSEFLNRNSPQPHVDWVSLLPCVCAVVGDACSIMKAKMYCAFMNAKRGLANPASNAFPRPHKAIRFWISSTT